MQTPAIPLHLPAPRTRPERMALLLALGYPPAYAARFAGYAPSTVATNACRLAQGPRIEALVARYAYRYGLLSEATLAQAIDRLSARIDSAPTAAQALTLTNTLFRLIQEQLSLRP